MQKNARYFDSAIGFIGVGNIAAALIKGFCGNESFRGKIFMYNRSPGKTADAEKSFRGRVETVESGQELIDKADIVFPTVLPDVLRKIAATLKFRRENRVVHVAAGINLTEARGWYEPACSIARAVPLSFASRCMGPIVLWEGDAEIRELLSLVGTVIAVPTEKELEVLASITGMMVPCYALMSETVKWGMSKGVNFQNVLDYTTSMNEALSFLMRNECTKDMEGFLKKNTTPNGMNELALKILKGKNVLRSWTDALEEVGKRYGLK